MTRPNPWTCVAHKAGVADVDAILDGKFDTWVMGSIDFKLASECCGSYWKEGDGGSGKDVLRIAG